MTRSYSVPLITLISALAAAGCDAPPDSDGEKDTQATKGDDASATDDAGATDGPSTPTGGGSYALCGVDRIRVGTEGAYPPWNFRNDAGELVGFEIDLMNAICDHLGLTCEWVAHEWAGILDALVGADEAGAPVEIEYDAMIASMIATPERKVRALFSGAHYVEPYRLVFNSAAAGETLGLGDRATEADLFNGKAPKQEAFGQLRFGSQVETHFEGTMRTLICGSADCPAVASAVTFETTEEAREALAAGDLDFILEGAIAAADLVDGDVAALGPGLPPDEGSNIATRKDELGNCLRHSFDLALLDLRAAGTYDDLADNYTDEEIWGPEAELPMTCESDKDCGDGACTAAPAAALDDRSICLEPADGL